MSIDHYVELEAIDESYTTHFERLAHLKRLKADIETEISQINADIADTYPNGGYYVDADGRELVVTIRRDLNAPKINLPLLQEIDADLAGKVVKFAVDTDKVKQFIERGYFTNTPAAKALTLTYKKPWVQITKKETETDE
jgi:hypothetical protein